MSIIKTRSGYAALAVLLMVTGLLLDQSAAMTSQALHHVAFVLSGVAIGFGFNVRR